MAKVLNPLMSNEARGKVNGLIYNTWRGISTVKTFKAPTKAKTPLQLAIMAKMTTISKAWGNLTNSQRSAWTVFADNHLRTDWTGNPIRMTGANAFSSCSMIASIAGNTPTLIVHPPTLASPVTDLATVVGGVGLLTITHTSPTTAADAIEVRWRAGDSQGRKRSLNEVKKTVVFLSNSAATFTLDAEAAPGKCTAFYRTISKLSGLYSQWTKQEVTVT